jgi:hypothetical protein
MERSGAANGIWDNGFFRAVTVSLKDLRLWFIVIPSLMLSGCALVLLKPAWLAGLASGGVALVAGYLISTVEKLPRPNEKELAESLYHKVLHPSAIGILIIPSIGLFAELWAMQWHWFHSKGSIPPCSSLWTIGILSWLGVLVVPAVAALLAKERAVLATMVGLIVYIAMSLTTAFSGDNLQQATTLLAKSCQVETDDFDADSFGVGMVTGVLTQALIAIFVAKVVSNWSFRQPVPPTR